MRNKILFVIPTANEENKEYKTAVGVDLGLRRFATMTDTNGNVSIMDNNEAYRYCELIENGESSEAVLDTWVFLNTKACVDEWKRRGIEAVYIGCCKGNFLKLCNEKKDHPFYKYRIFEKFVVFLENLCSKSDIHIESTDFDESYTSMGSSIGGDYLPKLGEGSESKFSGERYNGVYEVDKNITMNADVNASINILRKAGFSIYVGADSNLFDYISLIAS